MLERGGGEGRTYTWTDVWKFTPVSYRTSVLWGRCPKSGPTSVNLYSSILIILVIHFQMHQLHHLYEPTGIGPNGLLPPPFHSLLPTSAVPIVSASLVRHLGAPPSSLLAAPSPMIAASMSLPNGSSPVPPSISPALSSPIQAPRCVFTL